MDTLKHKIIIYDDVCPLCKAYTGAFIKMGWLAKRAGFATASPTLLQQLDLDRARHEIPLFDSVTGKTLYGLDALFLILGSRMPVFKPLFGFKPFRACVHQLYQLITYNRRIIAGTKAPEQGFDCAPDVNRFYRWLYIGLAGIAVMALAAQQWTAGIAFTVVALAQISLLVLGLWHSQDRLSVVGHWVTIALAALLVGSLLPAHWASSIGVGALSAWMWYKRWRLVFPKK